MAIKIVTPKAPPPPEFPPAIAAQIKLVYTQYPNVGAKILVMWGSAELQKYLNTTIFDDRGGRHGFPQPVVSALMQIYRYHETLIPKSEDRDIWDSPIV